MDRIECFIHDMAMEGFFLSTDHEVINFDKWGKGPHNILFLTGMSGGGKTTITEKLAEEYKVEMFEIDGIDYHYDASESKIIDQIEKEMPEYAEIVRTQRIDSGHAYHIDNDLYVRIFNKAIEIMHRNYNKLYIVEGIQIYALASEGLLEEPLIIMGTSTVTSFLRRLKRDGGGTINWKKSLKNEFIQLCRWYYNESKKFHKFKKNYGEVRKADHYG